MKNILILAPFCSLPNEPSFNRFLYLAGMLTERYDVTLVTSRFRHYDKIHRINDNYTKFKIVLIDEPGYKNNVSFKRIYSHHIFCENLQVWLTNNNKFDLVYSAFPLIESNLRVLSTLTDFIFVVDVQDIWPESIASVFPFVEKIPLKYLPFTKKANQVYSKADALVAVSRTYLERAKIVNRTEDSVVVYIGSDFDEIERSPAINLSTNNNNFRLVYIGTLSFSYDVETIIKSVNELAKEGVEIEFHIFGSGPFETKLKNIAGESVFFHGFVSFSEMVSFMKSCDVGVNCLSKSAKQSVTNKLSDFLSLGIPILNSQKNKEVIELLKSVDSEYYLAESVLACKASITNLYNRKETLSFLPNKEFDRVIGYQKITTLIDKLVLRNN